MFQKEGSCTDIISASCNQGNGTTGNKSNKGRGKGGKAQQTQETFQVSKAVDVPLRKSDRRRLRERAVAYFLGGIRMPSQTQSPTQSPTPITNDTSATQDASSNEPGSKDGDTSPTNNPMESLLDAIFSKGGTISSRSLPAPKSTTITAGGKNRNTTKGNHESMILYVKSPNTDRCNDHDHDHEHDSDVSGGGWPYRNKAQFVWMALEDKKSGKVLTESPTPALLAVLWHSIDFVANPALLEHIRSTRIVSVPSPVSRYLCRGADLMRAGIRSAPNSGTETKTETKTKTAGNTRGKGKKDDPIEASRNMVLICVQGNPQPFAVGRSILGCGCGNDNNNNNNNDNDNNDSSTTQGEEHGYGPGTKGIGVEVWSCYGDDLWRTTTAATSSLRASGAAISLEDGSYGNPGFDRTPDGELCVWPLNGGQRDDEDSDDDNKNDNDNGNNEHASNAEPSEEASAAARSGGNDEGTPEDEDGNVNLNVNVNVEAPGSERDVGSECGDESTRESNHIDQYVPTPAQINSEGGPPPTPDELLHETVCRALVHLGKNDLPMSVGTFYTKHVVPHRPKGVESMTVLMKETTYKKFGNYLKQWQIQSNQEDDAGDYSGLLSTGPDPSNRNNKDPNALLLFYNRKHSDLRGIKKTKNPLGDSKRGKSVKVVVVPLHVVPQQWTKLLRLDPDAVKAANASSEARRGTGMLTLPEVRKILDDYMLRESLGTTQKEESSSPSPSSSSSPSSKRSGGKVVLDGPLTDALYAKSGSSEEALSKKDIYKRFADRMSPAFGLVEMPGSNVLKLGHGKPPLVQIEVVRRQSKKFVTRLRGLEEYFFEGIEPAVFCKEVSKRLAISGSIDADPSSSGRAALAKKGQAEYVFGANIADELEALLTGDESLSEHGGVKGGDWPYPRITGAVIEVVLRKGVPARKKRRPAQKSTKR